MIFSRLKKEIFVFSPVSFVGFYAVWKVFILLKVVLFSFCSFHDYWAFLILHLLVWQVNWHVAELNCFSHCPQMKLQLNSLKLI
jgi:hypothetical protein